MKDEFVEVLDLPNRSCKAIEMTVQFCRNLRKTEEFARALVVRIKAAMTVPIDKLTYELINENRAMIELIIPSLPAQWGESDLYHPINAIRYERDGIVKEDSHRLLLFIRKAPRSLSLPRNNDGVSVTECYRITDTAGRSISQSIHGYREHEID